MLIGGSESDDSDDENEREWLQLFIQEIFNSIVIIPSTVALDACTINVNEELKIQEFGTNGCTCRLGHKQQPCCTTITSN